MPDVGQELLNVPFPEMVKKLAFAVADAQTELDKHSAEVAKFMAETTIPMPSISDPKTPMPMSMIALGFFPGFYQFEESIIEVKMAITMAKSDDFKVEAGAKAEWGPFSASVNASYSSKYDYKVEGSSLLRVRLTPVPPPAILTRYMETLIEVQSKEIREKIKDGETT
ncbi:MAG TPA: hypothetical protein PLZ42_01865 [Methanothrix sp.]|nr:hypothetical protein [Methanothrix sp.]